ncbi:MAG: pseudouridine synthase [Gammaproteobacteria bacterium]
MTKLVLFNKPYGVLSQFTGGDGRKTLANFISIKNVYAAGRLDKDSEGLLLLTDNGKLQDKIASPDYKLIKRYWVQVEGEFDDNAINLLIKGVKLKDGQTKPAEVMRIAEPENLWLRTPPVRFRKTIPTQWLEISIREGKNRQVRRMTAAVGHPTLRLIRHKIGDWSLAGIAPGESRILEGNISL